MRTSEQYDRAIDLTARVQDQANENFGGKLPCREALQLCQAHGILAVAEALNRIADAIVDDTRRNTARRSI